MQIKVKQIEYHRNGVHGSGFHAVVFDWKYAGKKHSFLASVFPEVGYVSVICLDLITSEGVSFGNKWDGPYFETALRAEIAIAIDRQNPL